MLFLQIFFIMLVGLLSFVGLLTIYGAYRFMVNGLTDDSNLTNFFRVFGHISIHPGDLLKMYYLTEEQEQALAARHMAVFARPFWYLDKDEFSEVVGTRPPR